MRKKSDYLSVPCFLDLLVLVFFLLVSNSTRSKFGFSATRFKAIKNKTISVFHILHYITHYSYSDKKIDV